MEIQIYATELLKKWHATTREKENDRNVEEHMLSSLIRQQI